MEKREAINAAEHLLQNIVKSQPNLLHVAKAGDDSGQNVAAFITALRAGLIEMYQQQG